MRKPPKTHSHKTTCYLDTLKLDAEYKSLITSLEPIFKNNSSVQITYGPILNSLQSDYDKIIPPDHNTINFKKVDRLRKIINDLESLKIAVLSFLLKVGDEKNI